MAVDLITYEFLKNYVATKTMGDNAIPRGTWSGSVTDYKIGNYVTHNNVVYVYAGTGHENPEPGTAPENGEENPWQEIISARLEDYASKEDLDKLAGLDIEELEGEIDTVKEAAIAINNLPGQKIENGGEIFNDYETNTAISLYTHAEGTQNISGTKAFDIIGKNNLEDGTCELTLTEELPDEINTNIINNVTILFSAKLKSGNYNCIGKIKSISGDIITVEKLDYTDSVYAKYYSNSDSNGADMWSCFLNDTLEMVDTDGDEVTDTVVTGTKANAFLLPDYPTFGNKDFGTDTHVEGYGNKALTDNAHAEGLGNIVYGRYGHAEGNSNIVYHNAHAEGKSNKATGYNSHAEGHNTISSGLDSHAEGIHTIAKGIAAHAEGELVTADGNRSHAEGFRTKASGNYSHSEGYDTTANGKASHVEGTRGQSHGDYNHVEGVNGRAWGSQNHVEGVDNWAGAEGAEVHVTHVEGHGTRATATWQHVQGKFNKPDSTKAHILGNGRNDTNRSNAHTIDWDGNAWFAGDVTVTTANGEVVLGEKLMGTYTKEEIDEKLVPAAYHPKAEMEFTNDNVTIVSGEEDANWSGSIFNTNYGEVVYHIAVSGQVEFSGTATGETKTIKIDGEIEVPISNYTFSYSGEVKKYIEIKVCMASIRFNSFTVETSKDGFMTGEDKAKLDSLKETVGDFNTALDELHAYAQGIISGGKAS